MFSTTEYYIQPYERTGIVRVVEESATIIVASIVEEKPKSFSIWCSCIQAARYFGADLPRGDAKDLKRNSTPTVGGVVILKYGSVYHVAYIEYMFPGAMWVKEGNKTPCQPTKRSILFTDEHIIGFFNMPDLENQATN